MTGSDLTDTLCTAFRAHQTVTPPPYIEEYNNESQPLLRRVQSIDSMDEDMNNQSNFDEMRSNLKLGMSCVWAILAGVTYASCRVMLKNVQLNAVDLTITSALVQVSDLLN